MFHEAVNDHSNACLNIEIHTWLLLILYLQDCI
jgi:hypothetical protein